MNSETHHKNHGCHVADNKASAHAGHGKSSWTAAAYATLHCLTGCVIGEVAGLMIGVSLGFHPYTTMAFSTVLAYITGFALTIFPLMKRTGFGFKSALKAIWIGEAIS